jgi:hypothetical protein
MVVVAMAYEQEEESGWGTWIRTKTNRVRVWLSAGHEGA